MFETNGPSSGPFLRKPKSAIAADCVNAAEQARGASAAPRAEQAAQPAEQIGTRRGSRLIDLERRAKFGRFGAAR